MRRHNRWLPPGSQLILLVCLARPEGLEPPAYWFEVKRPYHMSFTLGAHTQRYTPSPMAIRRILRGQLRGAKAGQNSTIWDSPSPKFIMGGSDEDKWDHPTQKPVELMRRPLRNYLRRGELEYDPFLGSGTALAAAELTERVCCGLELDPKYVDVIVERWQQLTGKKATFEGGGRTFDEIA